jgi:hypothetical protein
MGLRTECLVQCESDIQGDWMTGEGVIGLESAEGSDSLDFELATPPVGTRHCRKSSPLKVLV